MTEPKRDVLAELEAMIAGLSAGEKAALTKLAEGELSKPWLPNPGPQADAYYSKADLLLYGGAAGGGKTDLILGLALTEHERTVIFRRAYRDLTGVEERLLEILPDKRGYNGSDMALRRDGRVIEMGALEKPRSEESWQGRPHDLICFDEGAQLTQKKVSFVMGWNRSAKPNQRCRVVIASNPPMSGEGDWMIEWFAPWLDPTFPNPARDGELRWCIDVKGAQLWCEGPEKREIDGEEYEARSRTFIPALLDDNPYLKETGYRATLQALPEPMRSKLLHGDFLAGRQDHEWQVIPSEWVRLANERWRKSDKTKKRRMIALAADIALGGADRLILARLHEQNWFGELEKRDGVEFGGATGSDRIASLILKYRKDGADLSLDGTGGWGAGARSHLAKDHETDCASIVFSKGSNAKTSDGALGYGNLRAEMYWTFREALDPELGEDIALPPDPRLFAQLTAQRYKIKGMNIWMPPKEEQLVSPDESDAVVMAWRRRNAWARKAAIKAQNKPMASPVPAGPSSWMG